MIPTTRLTAPQRARWAAAAVYFITGFVVGGWAAQIPSFVSRLGISETMLGVLIFGIGFGAIITMTLTGQVIARIGTRPTFRLFAVSIIFTLPLITFAPNVWLAAIALTIFGVVMGGLDVAMNAHVVIVEKQLRRAIMSSSHGFWSLGGFAGAGVGGITIQAFGPVTHAMIVALVAGILVALAYAHVAEADEPPADDTAHASKKERYRFSLPSNPTIYVIGALALLCLSAEGAVISWSALYLQNELHTDIATAGFAFSTYSGAMALARFGGDGIRNRFGAVKTFRLSCILSGIGMLIVGLSSWPWLAIAAFTLCGIGIANLAPILFSTAGNLPGKNASINLSVVSMMGYSGILMAPSIIGFASDKVGLASVYIAVAVMMGAISLLSYKTVAADCRFR